MRRILHIFPAAATVFFATLPAVAAPTQEEVFRSINQNVGSTVDFDKYLPWILLILATIILAAVYNHRRQQPATARRLNHTGKLLRELSRALHLKSAEIKQLKLLAEEQDVNYPMTLLLCPSVLAKALRSRNPKVDRMIMEQIVQRLRGD